ncbi:MAG: hypothetical protein A3I03_11755 [Candidatus Rokubacteria bacterium RIFCSPLOWO2_02_FULL_68_19]|nr:MAG: hypothetical protein A3I03_11755 [Candidatus Rokubacteria bacterium RIFCSPLOWO2_02_FULL_68_19]
MLQGRRCAECGKLSLGAGHPCPFCGSEGGSAVALSGRGRLLSWTVIRVAPGRYAAEAPYAVGLLRLEEGLRLTARLEGDPERWSAGQAVSASKAIRNGGAQARP